MYPPGSSPGAQPFVERLRRAAGPVLPWTPHGPQAGRVFPYSGLCRPRTGPPSRAVVAAGEVVRESHGPRQAGGVMTVTDTQATWLTQDAYDRLKQELDELIANRPVIAAEINARREERSEERRVGKECRSRWWPYH